MDKIRHYINFNASSSTHILKTKDQAYFSAAICKYNSTDLSGFFLRENTITYVLSGNKYMFLNNQEFYLEEGDLLFIPKNTVIFTHISAATHNFESLNILLKKATLNGFWSKPVLFNNSTTLKMQLNSFLNEGFVATTLMKRSEILNELLNCLKNLKLGAKTDTLFYPSNDSIIHDVVIDTIFEPMTLDLLAEQSYMSVSTFKRKFKRHFKEAPKTWMRSIRLQAAYFYLKTNLYTVSDVATFVGFENLAHFTYAFKRYFKELPSSVAKR